MHIVVIGLNYRSAPVELRERLAINREQLPAVLAQLRGQAGVEEVVILSTCNRVEIYAGVPQLDGTIDRLQLFLSEYGRLALPELRAHLYSYTEPDSVRHLFTVASGIDSMVLGEGEILHQVKHAYELAREHGATGKVFNVMFQRALNAAKAVRTQTAIGRGCTSVGTVAVELAAKIFGDLQGAVVTLLGAGKIGELTLKRLMVRGVGDVRIVNRSAQRAQLLALQYGASAVALEALEQQLLEADIIITSSSAPGYVVQQPAVARAMRGRCQRPLCLIDLGVPRNVEPSVGSLENVYLFDIDDLQGLVDHHHQGRQQAVVAAQVIVDEKTERFVSWWQDEVAACVPSGSGLVAVR